MKSVNRLKVNLCIEGVHHDVGELVLSGKRIFFKYYPSFLDTGLLISPFKLPLSDKVLEPDVSFFEGLFGVFHDSLPDGWGRLLMDRTLTARGIQPADISPLDRLAFVGNTGHGALSYKPELSAQQVEIDSIQLDWLAQETKNVLSGMESLRLDELVQMGGSSGGARPKVFVGFNRASDHLMPDSENLPDGYEHWIIKFPSSSDPFDIAQIEYIYYKMALDAGITMSECRLFKGESGRYYFGTKRFDRIGNQRIHMHTAAGLMHDNFRLSNLDYGHLMDAAYKLERHLDAYTKIMRLAAFNILAHNKDDHSKNFSFLMDGKGAWQLASAYDLTFSSGSYGYHSTAVAGESQSPGKEHLRKLAGIFGINHVDAIIDQVSTSLSQWSKYAKEYDVSKISNETIQKALNQIDRV